MDVSSAIKKRRSIRKFKAQDLPHDLIKEILEGARLAPSGANRQPWQLVVVTDLDRRRGLVPLCKDQKFVADAGAFIAAIDDPAQKWARVDVAIALEHIALMAMEKGLGTCYVGAFDGERLAAYLGVPKPYVVTVGMVLGFPDEAPEARSRKPLTELVHWERFGGGD